MDNPEKLATHDTQEEEKQNIGNKFSKNQKHNIKRKNTNLDWEPCLIIQTWTGSHV